MAWSSVLHDLIIKIINFINLCHSLIIFATATQISGHRTSHIHLELTQVNKFPMVRAKNILTYFQFLIFQLFYVILDQQQKTSLILYIVHKNRQYTERKLAMLWKKLTRQKSKEFEAGKQSDPTDKQQRQYQKKGSSTSKNIGRWGIERGLTGYLGIDRVESVLQNIPQKQRQVQMDIKGAILEEPPEQKSIKQSKLVPKATQSRQISQSGHRSDDIEYQLSQAHTGGLRSESIREGSSSVGNSEDRGEMFVERQRQYFKSISLGKAKNKNQYQQRQLIPKQWRQEDQPVILDSDTEYNESKFHTGVRKMSHIQNKVVQKSQQLQLQMQMQMQDFFKQMQEAGIDVCDLQSNTKSRDVSVDFCREDQVAEQDRRNESASEERDITAEKKKHEKKQKQQKMEVLPMQQQKQLKKTKIRKSQAQLSASPSPKNFQKIRKLLIQVQGQVMLLKILKQQLTSTITLNADNNNNWIMDRNKQWSIYIHEILEQFRIKIKENQKMLKNQQNKIIQDLKYKAFQQEAELLDKAVILQRQKEINQELRAKNDQLYEAIFDLNQKLTQSQLVLQKKFQQFIENYPKTHIPPGATKNPPKEQQLLQIQRLSQQVQELTRLYENSQTQHKVAIQNEKIALALEVEKLARKETQLFQREGLLEERERMLGERESKVEEGEGWIRAERAKLGKKEHQLELIEKTLEEKLMKVQQIEVQLNQGFAEIDQVKKQSQQRINRLTLQNQQLYQQLENMQRRTHQIQQKYARRQHQEQQAKQKNLVSSLSNQMKINQVRQKILKSSTRLSNNDKNSSHPNRQSPRVNFHTEKEQQSDDYLELHACMNTERPSYDAQNEKNGYCYGDERPKNQCQRHNKQFYQSQVGNYRSRSGSGEKYPQRVNGYSMANNNYQNNFINSRKNPRFMSQIMSSSSSANPLPQFVLIKQSPAPTPTPTPVPQWRPSKQKYLTSPKKTPPKPKPISHRPHQQYQLNQLDSKIESLRGEIKREINMAKNRQ